MKGILLFLSGKVNLNVLSLDLGNYMIRIFYIISRSMLSNLVFT